VTYSIWIWSTVKSRRVTASIASSGQAVDKPTFELCPSVHRATCAVGSLPAYQAFELLVTDHIRKKAKAGEQVGLTVVIQGSQSQSGGTLSQAEAAVSTVLSQTGSSSNPGSGGGQLPTSAPLPGTTVTPPSDITSLFPVVTPSATPKAHHAKQKITKATSTASSLPLDPRLIGGQLAGLAVLAAAITMVMARLSLRTPQTASGPQPDSTTAAAPPAQPADADGKAQTDAKSDASDAGTPGPDAKP
jgi:hypothetical protein